MNSRQRATCAKAQRQGVTGYLWSRIKRKELGSEALGNLKQGIMGYAL